MIPTSPAPQSPLPATPTATPERTLRDLDLGCRIGFLVLTAILGYIAVRLSLGFSSHGFAQKLLAVLLKGTSFPLTTQLGLSGSTVGLLLSCLLPVVALISALAIRRPLVALLLISACNLTLGAISVFLVTALGDTFGRIINNLV